MTQGGPTPIYRMVKDGKGPRRHGTHERVPRGPFLAYCDARWSMNVGDILSGIAPFLPYVA